jgi:GNAT superfamily N-acetyltransferase
MLDAMPPGSIVVAPVRSSADHRAFCDLPYALYAADPVWVPPLRFVERRRWSTKHNPSLAHRSAVRFLARRDGIVVGRIAAILDPAFSARWESCAGFFGFFECIRDPVTADALLAHAESHLRAQGVRTVFGPVNLSTHDEVGLLVHGFDSRPMVLSPYNPPWYEGMLVDAGYDACVDSDSFSWDFGRPLSPAVARIVRRLTAGDASERVTLRRSEPRRWMEEGRALLETYNASFADVWGFVPLAWDEYRVRADEFRRFYRPEMAVFAESGGRVVGFALALPDINEALATIGGNLWPVGWLRLARAIRRIRAARFMLLGVLPDFRGRGIAPLLAHAVASAAREAGIRTAELSLVQGSNERIRHVIQAFGGRPLKTYRLFRKSL